MKIYVEDVLRIARGEIGYLEKASNYDLDSKAGNPGCNNYTKYARDLWEASPHFYQGSKQGAPWCTTFYDWCLYRASGNDSTETQRAKYYTGPYGAGCKYAAMYYKNANAWYNDPKPGDQIFFGHNGEFEHTGLVEKVGDGFVSTIEGNVDNAVKAKIYNLNDPYIIGYGRPDYYAFSPVQIPFVDVPSDAWYHDAVAWAYQKGITAGTDSTHFSPDAVCTRAMLVTMLYKLYNGE